MSPEKLRSKLVEMMVKADDGHCGSVMSLVEILCAVDKTFDLRRDHLLISKGHGGMAAYPIFAELGILSQTELDGFRQRGQRLTMFPNHTIPGCPVTLGSLGHGLGIGAGLALANPTRNVIVILGEGELYEGSTWEALLFINHNKIKNVRIVIDRNRSIVLGNTEDLLKLEPLFSKFMAFGFSATTVNGHDMAELEAALVTHQVVIAETVKGKGVPAWEGKYQSHYWMGNPNVAA